MPPARQRQIFRSWLWAGLLIAMTLLAYIPAMQGGFIWDDNYYVTNNPTLKTLDGLRKIWVELGATPQYYPLVFTSFWVQYQFWGLQPFAYHFVNVLLHALNAVLLWRILFRLRVPGAWLGAAIFALHPVHLESVAWITERKNVLSGLFYLSSLLIYLRFSLFDNRILSVSPLPGRNSFLRGISPSRIGLYLLATGLFICALLSKSVTCSMPAVVFLLLWWKRDEINWGDIQPLIPLFLLGILLAMNTVWMEKYHVGARGEEWSFSILERFLVAGRAFWFYAGKIVWPQTFSFIYPRWQIDSAVWWQYLFPLAAVTGLSLLWFLRRRIGKGPLTGMLIFGGTLLPALGFIDFYPMRFSFVADHFQYLASIGLIALCTAFIATAFLQAGPLINRFGSGLCVAVLAIFGLTVWQDGHKYKDQETLWQDTLVKNPQCWMAHNNIGLVLEEQGRPQEAIRHYFAALRIRPDYEEAHYNLGIALEKQGRVAQAVAHYSEALRINPLLVPAHNNLGLALEKQGRITEAISQYSEALRIDPDSAEAHNNLGVVLASQGDVDGAAYHYSKALHINPDFVEAHNNMGLALKKLGRITEAMSQYSEALRIDPDSAETHNNLGLTLAEQGKITEAIRHYSEALRVDPDSAEIHINLGNALAAQKDFPKAADQYKIALSLRPTHAQALNNLAILYSVSGEDEKALDLFKKIIELRPESAISFYNIARIYAKQNKIAESVDWLKKAIEKGYKNWDLIKTDEDLDNIRSSSYYKDLINNR
jgi:tetratricopeptide (TPR) repeat protein